MTSFTCYGTWHVGLGIQPASHRLSLQHSIIPLIHIIQTPQQLLRGFSTITFSSLYAFHNRIVIQDNISHPTFFYSASGLQLGGKNQIDRTEPNFPKMIRLDGEDKSTASFLDWLATPARHVPLAPGGHTDDKPVQRVIFMPGGGKIIFSSGGDFDPGVSPVKNKHSSGGPGSGNLKPHTPDHIPFQSSVLPGPHGTRAPTAKPQMRSSSSRHSHRRQDGSQASGAHYWSGTGGFDTSIWFIQHHFLWFFGFFASYEFGSMWLLAFIMVYMKQ